VGVLVLTAAVAVALAIYRSTAPISGRPATAEELHGLRNDVKGILRPGCGSCHTTGHPAAKPAALAVFDFSREDWSGHMSADQLQNLRHRSGSMADSLMTKLESLIAAEMVKWEDQQKDEEAMP
jgi:hypothetical protein